jgi:hypothetical protein
MISNAIFGVNMIGNGRVGPIALVLAAVIVLPDASGAEDRNNVTIYASALAVSGGLTDRQAVGAFVNAYEGDVGVHGDFVYVNREEDAGFGAVGFSWRLSEEFRPKIMVGASTDNSGVLPEFSAALSMQIRPEEFEGWIFTPSLTHRSYRNGVEESRPAFEAVKYFSLASDQGGYYVAQGRVSATMTGEESNRYSFSGGLQTVRKSGVTYGLSAEGGWLDYDSILGADGSRRFFALRPSVSLRIDQGCEVFVRGEYANTDLYDAIGATSGLKFEF